MILTETNPVGIGTWRMGMRRDEATQEVVADPSNDAQHLEALRYSLSLGQNHIDTAELYGQGHTEQLVGEAIKGFERSKLFVASKLWLTHYQRGQVVPAVKGMLERLDISYLDLLYAHTPETEVPMAEYLAGMNEAVEAGLVRSLGVSNFNLEQLREAMDLSKAPIVALQNRYNVTYREKLPQDLLDFCHKNSVTVVAYRPVERGSVGENPVLAEIAQEHGATAAQVALSWLIQQEGVVAIPKASSKAHIEENLGALNLTLNQSDLARLEDAQG